ncbi:glycosyltransferase family 4 protein [Corynebacterium tuberculostearicum]|uniref:Glycosyltransferase, group 1 family protein n=1 Tax=Corynebacterium tuberculostearicum SK141 TaxID=553206 RepID=C6R9P1_9CORY|nr:glycosyltransferase family 4 protein [Corynebacterium tuberculostearicum]EET77398.1 glycosyltransferase, group 1 family protein [Corynebacterium tuberculostearicum SK141]MCG7457920.1 glycosyltransferase family 4 protein [Corynebacterium tuberculostearicum]
MKKALRWLNYSAVVIPFAVEKFLLEPEHFIHQAKQRFLGYQAVQQSKFSAFDIFGSSKLVDGKALYLLVETGNYQEFESAYSRLSLVKKFLHSHKLFFVRTKRKQFDFKIHKGVDRVSCGRDINLLYFVNNSSPYTQSGYTVRTAALVDSLRGRVNALSVVSRLGYPLVIGKVPESHNSVPYQALLIPKIWPFGEQKKYDLAKKMLLEICRKQDIAVIQTTSDFKNAALISDVANELGVPWIYEMRGEPHNTWLSKFPASLASEAKRSFYYRESQGRELEAAKKASAVVVLSKLSQEKLIQSGISESKVTVVPNAVDRHMKLDPRSAFAIRRKLGFQNKKIIGTISSLVSYEGLETLIRAVQFLDDDIQLVLVGDGEDRRRLFTLCKSLGVSDRVYFAGKQPANEIQGWYSIFDVFVVPRTDSTVTRNVTPIKILNALALGTPVVCSDLPALREVTGGFAMFVPPDSPTDLAVGIREAIKDPAALAAEKFWLEENTWEANSRKLAMLYRELTTES